MSQPIQQKVQTQFLSICTTQQ